MRNSMRLVMIVLAVITLSILTASCSKRNVERDAYITQEAETETERQSDQISLRAVEGKDLQDASAERELQIVRDELESEDIYFDKKSYNLLPAAQEILIRKAEWLMEYPEISVIIQGHTDEPGPAEYNFALGDRRAGNVKGFLIQQGINPSRLTAVSFGKEMPAEPGSSEAARAKNRRVHFVIEY